MASTNYRSDEVQRTSYKLLQNWKGIWRPKGSKYDEEELKK
jgi:hypothetical protein